MEQGKFPSSMEKKDACLNIPINPFSLVFSMLCSSLLLLPVVPRVFMKRFSVVMALLRFKEVTVIQYLDDILIKAPSRQENLFFIIQGIVLPTKEPELGPALSSLILLLSHRQLASKLDISIFAGCSLCCATIHISHFSREPELVTSALQFAPFKPLWEISPADLKDSLPCGSHLHPVVL